MADRAPGKPHPVSTQGFGAALRHAAARGAGTVEIEGMARARLLAFLAQELARARAWAAGHLAPVGHRLAAGTRRGPGERNGD
jgi:hypothetical protein